MTKQEAALKIIEQEGKCRKISCADCPLCEKEKYICEEYTIKYKNLSLVEKDIKQFCIDFIRKIQLEFEF